MATFSRSTFRLLSPPLAIVAVAGCALAQAQPIDLSSWVPVQYELNSQPDASWQLQPGNTSVIQTVNADPCILLSDFDAASQVIRGTWHVGDNSDNDFMGFVFGYQDRGQYYLFDWKQSTQTFGGATATQGMSLKIVQKPAGVDPDVRDLWSTAGTANVTVPLHNDIPWVALVDYEFVLRFTVGNIEISVLEAGNVLEHWVLNDSTYTSGNFGFYNCSQAPVVYESFTQQAVSTIYCSGKSNSAGCVPQLFTTGSPSFSSPGDFEILATSVVNNKRGMLFYSLSGRSAAPFGGGVLCVQPPLRRMPVVSSMGDGGADNCSGSLSFNFNAWLQSGVAHSLIPGDQLNAQYFYRDPHHADGTGYGLTPAVEFVLSP